MNTMYTISKTKLALLVTAAVTVSLLQTKQAIGQVVSGLRNPYVPGTSVSGPFIPAPMGAPPAYGSGPTPSGVTPGMGGLPPSLIPSIPAYPSNDINLQNTGLSLPISPSIALPPGTVLPILAPLMPNAPSTPGPNLGMLRGEGSDPVTSNPAQLTANTPVGVYPGTGGYYTTMNKIPRTGTQHTYEYEYRETNPILGGGGTSQDEVTQFGPLAGWGVPYGVPTGPGYNVGPPGMNNDNYNYSLDLGGGMQSKIGGTIISSGQTVQDYGLSTLYGNANPILNAANNYSTEFGQGLPVAETAVGQTYNTSTDFGFPLTPRPAGDHNPLEPNAGLPQQVVETNF